MSFGKKDDTGLPGVRSALSSEAFLGKGSKVTGTLVFSGSVELDGEIEGEIHGKDRVTIGEQGMIRAKIAAAEIIIRGTVQGDLTASKSISLKRPAKVVGNLSTPNLVIEEGVLFEGKCSMIKNTPVQAATSPSTTTAAPNATSSFGAKAATQGTTT